MKKIILYSVLVFYFMITGFYSEPEYYREYRPVFMAREEMEASVKLDGPRTITDPGKIYIKDNLILINEKYRGIHVIDNTIPEEPDKFAFIHIDGCIDMAMNGNVLYADNAVDLIALTIGKNMDGIHVTSRTRNVFPELIAPDGRGLDEKEVMARPDNTILVRWEKR